MLAAGKSMTEIATAVNLSYKTISATCIVSAPASMRAPPSSSCALPCSSAFAEPLRAAGNCRSLRECFP